MIYDSEDDSMVPVPVTCGCGRPVIFLSPELLGCEHCDTVCTNLKCEECIKFERRFGAGL